MPERTTAAGADPGGTEREFVHPRVTKAGGSIGRTGLGVKSAARGGREKSAGPPPDGMTQAASGAGKDVFVLVARYRTAVSAKMPPDPKGRVVLTPV